MSFRECDVVIRASATASLNFGNLNLCGCSLLRARGNPASGLIDCNGEKVKITGPGCVREFLRRSRSGLRNRLYRSLIGVLNHGSAWACSLASATLSILDARVPNVSLFARRSSL